MQLRGITLALFVGAASAARRLDLIELPVGFRTEGITFARGWTAYVSSTAGAIWKGNMANGAGEVVVPASGSMALGMDFDKRTDYLYVAGGKEGTLRVYDRDYNIVWESILDPDADVFLVTNVIVGGDYVYATDATKSQLYALPLGEDAKPVDGANTVADIVRISGDSFPPDTDGINNFSRDAESTGIVLSDDETMVIIAVVSDKKLFLVDVQTGKATQIDLQGEEISGTGLVRRHNTLWVVDSGFNTGLGAVYEVALSDDWTCGKVTRVLMSDPSTIPITGARKNNGIYVTNGQRLPPNVDTSNVTYVITRVDRDMLAADCY